MELQKKLNVIQQELKVPKNQKNTFGNYNYRSCEDILEAVKPLLGDLILTISDEIVNLGDRYYIKATVKLQDESQVIKTSAYAREALIKKGMDEAQITGSASSYARKYALNGLFAIDDEKDPDTKDNTVKSEVKSSYTQPSEAPMPEYSNPIQQAKVGDKCSKCGADMVLNPKTGKYFCKDKCWTK